MRSRISTIIEHLLKLEHSSAREPREGWRDTVDRSRREAKLMLKETRAFSARLAELLDEASANFAEFALQDLIRRGELDKSRQEEILARPYTEDQVLGEWFPDGWPDPRSDRTNPRNGAALEAVARHKKAAPAG